MGKWFNYGDTFQHKHTHTHHSRRGKVLKLSRPRKLIYIYSKPQSSSVFAYLYLCCDLHSNDDNSSTSSCKGKQPTASATFAVSFSILHFNYLILLQSACLSLSLAHHLAEKLNNCQPSSSRSFDSSPKGERHSSKTLN